MRKLSPWYKFMLKLNTLHNDLSDVCVWVFCFLGWQNTQSTSFLFVLALLYLAKEGIGWCRHNNLTKSSDRRHDHEHNPHYDTKLNEMQNKMSDLPSFRYIIIRRQDRGYETHWNILLCILHSPNSLSMTSWIVLACKLRATWCKATAMIHTYIHT